MIISIAHQKGGVGKSTLAFNLAYYLSKYKPLLLDLDIQNTISYANKIREQNTKKFNVATIASDDFLKEYIKSSNDKNLIIIDTGGFDSSLNRLSIIASDLILTPVSDKMFELLGLKKFESILQELSEIKKSKIIAKVVLNNISPSVKKFDDLHQFIGSSPHFEIIDTVIRQRADIAHASSKGLSVGEYSIGSKADIEYKNLSSEIKKIIFK
ncbi:MAG: ParA family protein [Burkholderiales bacterium]|nr:ParA family protein [Burkholderiales bacterium]